MAFNDADDKLKFRDNEELNTEKRAKLLKIPYLDSRTIADIPLATGVLTNEEMYKYKLITLYDKGANYTFGITLQTPQQTLRELRERFNDKVIDYKMISLEGYKEFMLRFDPPVEVHYDDITVSKEGASDNVETVSQTLEGVKSDDILEYVITQADKLGASDIHFETARTGVRFRFRLDGALHLIAVVSHQKYRQLQQSIAVKANISTSAPDAQTGHLSQSIARDDGTEKVLNMRIETVPTLYGQDAIVRLFNMDASLLNLDNLGLSERERKPIDEVISHPHGMVLMVGPTGSGKTTTLYSILQKLNEPTRKIITLEDPVEYGLEGMSQIPVYSRQGDSFASKLRAVMRLDPDVIMVGEIRDVDTARTALQASITGHLVLSTFHAGSSAEAFTRMIDMIGQNPILISAIKLIISQRLVRRLDDTTKQAYEPDAATQQHIRETLENLSENIEKPNLDKITLYKPGKSEENPFGYKGRLSILEQLTITPEIQALLRNQYEVPTSEKIEEEAR
ncbi:Flp pilus assembly complex ATPase component TadA, partial [Candidatus Saccharibacteria bacterium]|nr:Flp pilus assembly complex ATPase component TadA [Candidatus Saccharibacteria bacterium]